jgi:hypothetical protein
MKKNGTGRGFTSRAPRSGKVSKEVKKELLDAKR